MGYMPYAIEQLNRNCFFLNKSNKFGLYYKLLYVCREFNLPIMKSQEFTPKESLELIDQVIKEAKNRFEENGFTFILWGGAVALCCFAQAYLLHTGMGAQSWYPYLLLPLLSIYTMVHEAKKHAKKYNPLNRISSRLWIFTGFNIMIVAFGFSNELQSHLTPIILLLMGIATAVAGSFIQSRMLLFCGIVLNISAYVAFFVPWKHHPLLMGVVALVAFFGPGIVLHLKHKK